MITKEELDILRSAEVRQSISDNLERDPLKIALDKKEPFAHLVATQVKYLQRAKTKLPSYYAARCIIPSLAFEQSSSEQTAQSKDYSGELCIDLTAGLGVDSFAFSKRFQKVVTVEQNEVLAQVTTYNLTLLRADNVEVVHGSAEEFARSYNGPIADLVYLDPDRRSDSGRKLVTLEECSPNVPEILDDLKRIARKVVIKLSPMFDVDEAFRIFGEGTRVEVVSLGGECKEVLVELDPELETNIIAANIIGCGRVECPAAERGKRSSTSKNAFTKQNDTVLTHPRHKANGETLICCTEESYRDDAGASQDLALTAMPEQLKFLVVPDVALSKGGIATSYYGERGVWLESERSFGFAASKPTDIFGKIYEIESIEAYSPKSLRKRLKAEGVKSINVLRRNFPVPTKEIVQDLGVGEGGEQFLAFTRLDGKPVSIRVRRVK